MVSFQTIGIVVAAIFVYRFWDLGQCNRACRVVHGSGAPKVHGSSGSWAQIKIEGSRQFFDPGMCSCQKVPTPMHRTLKGGITPLPSVPRYHKPIQTKDQWWFNTDAVCGTGVTAVGQSEGHAQGGVGSKSAADTLPPVDGLAGNPRQDAQMIRKHYDSEAQARADGASVLNCGQCGMCSTTHDTDRMHIKSKSLTKLASVAAVIYLFFGQYAHRVAMQSQSMGIGYSDNCAWCWTQATECNLANCARHCLFGWQNPLSSDNNVQGTDAKSEPKLNACLHCDEIYCSAYYLQVTKFLFL